jgi:hypothetical protein
MKIAANLTYTLKSDDENGAGKVYKLHAISLMEDVPNGEYKIQDQGVINTHDEIVTRMVALVK